MEALVAFGSLILFAYLGFRFGYDSRDGVVSSEHGLARLGMRWEKAARPAPGAGTGPAETRSAPIVTLRPQVATHDRCIFPTLAVIDEARGAGVAPFGSDPHAARLERRARELVAEYWSDSVWFTGLVPGTSFATVCAALEQERASIRGTVHPFPASTGTFAEKAAAS